MLHPLHFVLFPVPPCFYFIQVYGSLPILSVITNPSFAITISHLTKHADRCISPYRPFRLRALLPSAPSRSRTYLFASLFVVLLCINGVCTVVY
jgi:hypothetical protein